jgi:hypothetical protein
MTLTSNNHTDKFQTRSPNGMAAIAAHHAAIAPPTDVSNGVDWNATSSGVTSVKGAYPALSLVNDATQFDSLFKQLPMYFTFDELKLIVGDIQQGAPMPGKEGALGKVDELFKARQIAGTNEMASVSLAGRGQSILSRLVAINNDFATITNATTGDFGPAAQLNAAVGDTVLGVALAKAVAAFRNSALTTMVIGMDRNDQHGQNLAQGLDNPASSQGDLNIKVGNALAGTLKALARFDDPLAPGKKLIDSTAIILTTEFNRTALVIGGDNGDGGMQTGVVIGPGTVFNTGAFGDINVATGAFQGFDAATGGTGGATPDTGFYKTVLKGLGAPDATHAGVTAPIFGSWLK